MVGNSISLLSTSIYLTFSATETPSGGKNATSGKRGARACQKRAVETSAAWRRKCEAEEPKISAHRLCNNVGEASEESRAGVETFTMDDYRTSNAPVLTSHHARERDQLRRGKAERKRSVNKT